MARQHQVSRKFLYQQADTATHALSHAFDRAPATEDVLFGTVHNIVHSVVEPARAISRQCDLAGVRIGAHDEIFQADHPVLVGVDTASTYCYLLSLEDHRDAVTWGVRLLELVDQGFDPDATVADAGSGLRAGQALALPEIPCRGDIFHVLRDLEQVVRSLANRAYGALEDTERRRQQLDSAQRHDGRGRAQSIRSAAQLLRRARAAGDAAVAALAQGTVRASSLVENLNSRLRSYFFLRLHLGSDYLALLQFFLNHRKLERSDRPERVGKTPAELLTGQSHPHWLEMLGYTRFVRA